MRRLFELMNLSAPATLRDAAWNQELGADAASALRDLGLLEPCERATTYPCDSYACHGCSRRVEPHPWGEGHAFSHLARCADPSDEEDRVCEGVELHAEDLDSSRFVRSAFVDHLRRLLWITSARPAPRPGEEAIVPLGRRGWAGIDRPVFLAWYAHADDFEGFLDRHQMASGEALVLVPLAERLPIDLRERHKPNDTVAVVGLERLLDFEEGRFTLAPWTRSLLSSTSALKLLPRLDRHCLVLENGQEEREVDLIEYLELTKHERSYDFYLDLLSSPSKGTRVAGLRPPGGEYRRTRILASEALAVAQVVRARQGLCPRDFHRASPRTTKTYFEGRKKLDVLIREGKAEHFRAFQTLSGSGAGESRFLFSPPANLRYLVLHNLDADLKKPSREEAS